MVEINQLMGDFGPYHLWLCFIIFINRFGVAFHQFAIIFLAPPPHYHCPDVNERCCDNPVYNTSLFKSTIVTEWNLICERSWMKNFNQTIFQFGVLIGSFIFGVASDRFGRKPMLIVAVILELFMGAMSSFLPDYWSFTMARLILGIAIGGVLVIAYVLVMEYIGNSIRDLMSGIFHVPYSMGIIILPAFGFYIRSYTYFQLSISLSNVILLFYICALPESPRWLLIRNRTQEAIMLLEKIAKTNNLPTDHIREKIAAFQTEHRIQNKSNSSVLHLFRTPRLRQNLLIMSFSWLTCSFCFYGVSHYISHLTGNIFINVVANGSVCLCGCGIALPLIKYASRKTVVISAGTLSSVCILTIAAVPEGSLSIIFGCIGVMCCYVSFIILYLYCSELFPTVVRNGAMGVCNMISSLGAMVAPFVADMRTFGKWCAPVAFGILPLMAALLCFLLPETKGNELLMTFEEGENLRTQPQHKGLNKNVIKE